MTESDAKLSHRVQRCEFLNAIRHKQTRQGRFDAAMYHFDHPIPGTPDCYLNPSDRGAGADAVVENCEETPLWERLWINAYAKLKPQGKRILNALMVDWRTASAARIAGVSRPTADRWKTFFRMHFAQCFQAYKRDLGGCGTLHFSAKS